MSSPARDLLIRGLAAAKANQPEEARFYLEWLLRADASDDERQEAWCWLSEVSRDPAEVLEAIQGYRLKAVVPYNPRYLADWPAESYTLSLADASLVARRQCLHQQRARTGGTILEPYTDLSITPAGLTVMAFNLLLLPTWLVHYTLETKQANVVLNGQTGTLHARPPRTGLRKVLAWLGEVV